MLRRYLISNLVSKRNISALFVTGDKAKENFAVLTPFMKFEERFDKFDEVQDNIRRRKLKINSEDLMDEYKLYVSMKDRRKSIENRRVEIAKQIKDSPESPNLEGLRLQGEQLREDLKLLKQNSYHLEDTFVHHYLDLPNYLHENTPDNEKKVIYTYGENRGLSTPISDELIEFYDPTCYYMKGEAAKFDLLMPMTVLDYFRAEGFINFSNPDFARSVIVEGAGIPSKDVFIIKEEDTGNKWNLLHLTGSASFLTYFSFVTKLSTYPSLLPLKLISTGKQYDARNHYEHQDIFKTVQSTCCQSFVIAADASNFNEIINEHITHLKAIFEPLGVHFRIVYYPAGQLSQAETCRIGVEMFSPSQNEYVEVGNFSCYGDYISKRLLFNYREDKDYRFPHIYSGTVVNVLKLILVLIENNTKFECPERLMADYV